jgi:hypothetical protein
VKVRLNEELNGFSDNLLQGFPQPIGNLPSSNNAKAFQNWAHVRPQFNDGILTGQIADHLTIPVVGEMATIL